MRGEQRDPRGKPFHIDGGGFMERSARGSYRVKYNYSSMFSRHLDRCVDRKGLERNAPKTQANGTGSAMDEFP